MQNYIILDIAFYILSYIFYVRFSNGLGHKAEYLQLRRFFPCAVLAVLPMYLTDASLLSAPYLISALIGVSWIVTYPYFFYRTHHKNSSDFGFHLDTVFGLYIIGWLVSLKLLAMHINIFSHFILFIISCIEWFILLIPVLQIIYYFIYKICIDESSLMLILETDNNETIEFYKSLPLSIQIFTPFFIIFSLISIIYVNLNDIITINMNLYHLLTLCTVTIFLTIYLWNTKKGVFIRTGIVELFLDVKKYIAETTRYKSELQQRLASLEVTNKNKSNNPSTIILVIGESESRDYMSAFSKYNHITTPWLDEAKDNSQFILFNNAYACKDQTVPALENAITEANQYNDKKFYESCSIIDIAKKAGYKTYWFSNQGHIGSAETAITLIANTCDHAEWTKQNLNKFQYDNTLLDYLEKVNPKENNFIVLHLMGSHFNFINRYPFNFAHFSKPGKYDLIPNYLDSIRFTDYVLKEIIEYANTNLNLNALVYFSDHATIPDKRRSSNFGGFATVRIPLFTYFSDVYIKNHSEIYNSLQQNNLKYFTNDLIYELMCSILDIKSNHFDETNSIASKKYKYTRDMLKTDLGKLYIKDDNTDL